MSEKIITEHVSVSLRVNDSYVFPEIQAFLDDGYLIKNIFYSFADNRIYVTAHLVKS
ncbi:hypothetical protein [Flavobacterium covae]|uniref:hypothetical protein n=1 Tax=Flavobacterium covae TaxID=2906076 RepID=UPI0013FD738B|nr:hypothetical protein [Flavobacterium covae]